MNDWLYAGLKSHREPNAVAERVLADRYEVPPHLFDPSTSSSQYHTHVQLLYSIAMYWCC